MPLYLNVDPGNGLPVYLQIVDQVRRAVAIGVLKPGEQLPTVKQLASDLVVNPATVSRSLRELEHLGIVQSLPGRGAFVRGDAAAGVAKSGARDVVGASIDAAIREARSLGVDEADLQEIFRRSLDAWYRGDGTHGA
ncbi:MAG TPA: GntR family transcriptional regulator [Candidatus Baltobacteraceae bacterium]|nr:GntR family transcriptional regulator [Candidatus Baltobacteraceae bacterium]